MTETTTQEEIVHYYDTCEGNYRKWWKLDQCLAMHAGYWDETTKTLKEAINRENQVLAALANVAAQDRVLDAGCGYGGSSLYLAQHHGCRVTGITLSARQVEVASSKAAERGLGALVDFQIQDYTNTGFTAESFDLVWAIESVCHAPDKRDFIREAWRLLKPGGRLIIADGFNVKEQNDHHETKLIRKAMNGWSVEKLDSIDTFTRGLAEQGFSKIIKTDATKNVIRSSRRLFFYSFPAITLSKLGEYLGWSSKRHTEDFKSYFYQYLTVRKGLCKYYIVQATKS
jgi:tocopherol O-methyltransferase